VRECRIQVERFFTEFMLSQITFFDRLRMSGERARNDRELLEWRFFGPKLPQNDRGKARNERGA